MAFGISAATAAVVGGGLAAAGAVGGALISAKGAKSAANAQAQAAQDANALQQYMYDQTREDQAPGRTVGNNALNQLALRMGVPGYISTPTSGVSLEDAQAQTQENFDPQAYLAANPDVAAAGVDPWVHYTTYGANEGRQYTYNADAQRNAAAGTFDTQGYLDANPDVAASGMDPLTHYLQYGKAEGRKFATAQNNPLYGSLTKNFSAEDFQKDPGYEFRLGEGQKALEASAAARGGLLSGAAAKALSQYNQNFASNEYQNAYNRFNTNQTNTFNRLASLAGVGQTATAQTQAAGQNYANRAGQNTIYAGTARASGVAGQANALAGGLGYGANQLSNVNWGGYGNNNPYGSYSATTSPVPDYYSGVNGTPLA
ncbi:conserved exported hypothetical protein [Cupriavidus phytorum]|uniref:DNA transfer protein p32 n=1 Tax=Cupriavidus taiwanensis TaxID=164546 RepID=A0A975XBZ7_9BURK|nr:hypothetical protein [Cupriavidus taiwanensis]SOY65589.1 conserved exported hypothetical protein [Cupriavidus taiwanensis]